MRVLVVEDNPAQAESLEMLLQTEGHSCYLAFSARGAKALAEIHPPDVVILDWILEGGNGAGLLAWLRGQPKFADTPVIISTGLPADHVAVLPLRNTVIMEKPYPPEKLMSYLKNLAATLQPVT